jgi:DNA/RNA-binding domain of Phe-tRNA-synthetase-like protein
MDLWTKITSRAQELTAKLEIKEIVELRQIEALRKAYRLIGKDPSRVRGSQEALLRRILKGQQLYQINTIVDINNLVSLHCLHSVGSYNLERLHGNVVFRVGRDAESYKGIGKDVINIGGLPVFADELGPFGSPTSDSERAMITLDARRIMMVVIAFSGSDGIAEVLDYAASLLCTHAGADIASIEKQVVE